MPRDERTEKEIEIDLQIQNYIMEQKAKEAEYWGHLAIAAKVEAKLAEHRFLQETGKVFSSSEASA